MIPRLILWQSRPIERWALVLDLPGDRVTQYDVIAVGTDRLPLERLRGVVLDKGPKPQPEKETPPGATGGADWRTSNMRESIEAERPAQGKAGAVLAFRAITNESAGGRL